ncbi:putative glycoside hydrolase family 45 protein [Rosellinia necatrix]|uniref:Putative glycoside hydrolase family 45 protein n=1 Tax=Rosellinia necatrix TaxID=77044 RepID=A0A1W2TT21_ROSNE|nr:putative glycoside hydrolase family 45 protein [Rosellinia necatrix]
MRSIWLRGSTAHRWVTMLYKTSSRLGGIPRISIQQKPSSTPRASSQPGQATYRTPPLFNKTPFHHIKTNTTTLRTTMRTSWALLAAPLGALAQLRASFTEYGSGDINGSSNCVTSNNACGFAGGGYTAALSQAQFGAGPGQGAGPACGSCYQITVQTDLNGSPVQQRTITVKVDNLCPIDGNPICNVPNSYGADIHFDLCIDSGAAGAFFTSSGAGLGYATQVSC